MASCKNYSLCTLLSCLFVEENQQNVACTSSPRGLNATKHPFSSSENRLIKYFVHSRQNMPGPLTNNTILIFDAPGIESEYWPWRLENTFDLKISSECTHIQRKLKRKLLFFKINSDIDCGTAGLQDCGSTSYPLNIHTSVQECRTAGALVLLVLSIWHNRTRLQACRSRSSFQVRHLVGQYSAKAPFGVK